MKKNSMLINLNKEEVFISISNTSLIFLSKHNLIASSSYEMRKKENKWNSIQKPTEI